MQNSDFNNILKIIQKCARNYGMDVTMSDYNAQFNLAFISIMSKVPYLSLVCSIEIDGVFITIEDIENDTKKSYKISNMVNNLDKLRNIIDMILYSNAIKYA